MTGVGKRIKQRRIEIGLSQDELAAKMGYSSRTSICKIETGKEDNLSLNRVRKFADVLDCSVERLMGWDTPDDIIYNRDNGKLINEVMNDFKLRNFIEMYLWLDDAQKDAVFNLVSSMYSKDS